jgi:prepilin-type N-terminal cleavage/methylation domain-containing protein/prepilin-type processing-associated H-X9-DG protein
MQRRLRAFTFLQLPAVSMRERAAFTLVELLVVIGIISVLIAILLPTLAGARRSAATVKCAAHLRDLGNAIQIYANENGQYIPTIQSTYPGKVTPMWYDQLGKYVFKSGVASVNLNAPSVPASIVNDNNFSRTPFAGCPAYEFVRYEKNPLRTSTGYGLNVYPVAPATITLPSGDKKLVRNFYPGTASSPARFFKLVEMKNPTNRALMADANGYGGIQAADPDPINAYTPQPGPDVGVAGDIDYYRHSRLYDLSKAGCNILFADLHVDLCPPWEAFWSIKDPVKRANGLKK